MSTLKIADFIEQEKRESIGLHHIMPAPETLIMPETAIVAAARTSYLGTAGNVERDKKLFKYLLDNQHTSPFEMSEMLFRADMPIQGWLRLTEDSRIRVAVLRENNLSTEGYIRIDLNNALRFIDFHREHPLRAALERAIAIAYPWTAEFRVTAPQNTVHAPAERNHERMSVLDDSGSFWVEMEECGATDAEVAEMILFAQGIYNNGLTAEHNTEEIIRSMFRLHDLRPLSLFSAKFAMRAPLVTYWQLVRHRSFNLSMQSGRYMAFGDDFYMPAVWRKQSTDNKQGSSGEFGTDEGINVASRMVKRMADTLENGGLLRVPMSASQRDLFNDMNGTTLNELFQIYVDMGQALYNQLLEEGGAKEQSRFFLPAMVAPYQAIIKCDLMFLIRFFYFRTDHHAQEEIRLYAEALAALWESAMPITAKLAKEFLYKGI